MKKILLFTFVLIMGFPVASQNQLKKLDQLFNNLAKDGDFNGNIVIAKGDEIVYQRSFGFADFQNKIQNTKETVFELASMGKQFTAMGIIILKEQGKLDFDDDASMYLPAFPYSKITIRQLLTMTSGIPDYLNFSAHWDMNAIATNTSILNYYSKAKPALKFPPGAKFNYSNVNYVYLAEIIKNVSGEPFNIFLKRNIFDKIGMKSTRSYTTRFQTNEIVPNYAFPNLKKDNTFVRTNEFTDTKYIIAASGIEGDGSIISTTTDLVKWSAAVNNGQMVSPDLIEQAYSTSILASGEENNYGFGMYVDHEKNWHWGGWPGIQTAYTRYLKNNITVIYLKNVESNNWQWTHSLEKIIKKL